MRDDEARHARDAWTSRTGVFVMRATRPATLPTSQPVTPRRPCVPMTTLSAFHSSASMPGAGQEGGSIAICQFQFVDQLETFVRMPLARMAAAAST